MADYLRHFDQRGTLGGLGAKSLTADELREKLQLRIRLNMEQRQNSDRTQTALIQTSDSTQTALGSTPLTETPKIEATSNELPTKKSIGRMNQVKDGMRFCPRCKERKIVEEFKSKNGRSFYGYCYSCYQEYSKELRLSKDLELGAVGLCKLCGQEAKLVFDHDHKTKRFRGKICRPCNTGLGMFKDSIDILKLAIRYLTPPKIKE